MPLINLQYYFLKHESKVLIGYKTQQDQSHGWNINYEEYVLEVYVAELVYKLSQTEPTW